MEYRTDEVKDVVAFVKENYDIINQIKIFNSKYINQMNK